MTDSGNPKNSHENKHWGKKSLEKGGTFVRKAPNYVNENLKKEGLTVEDIAFMRLANISLAEIAEMYDLDESLLVDLERESSREVFTKKKIVSKAMFELASSKKEPYSTHFFLQNACSWGKNEKNTSNSGSFEPIINLTLANSKLVE
jgi:hypothetical protein